MGVAWERELIYNEKHQINLELDEGEKMAGDFVGCALIRKKSTSGSANSSGGTNSDGQRSSRSSSSTKRNNESGESRSRRIFDNNNGNGGGSGGGRSNPGVLVPVAHYKDPLKTYKIVILGDGGVGKSGE